MAATPRCVVIEAMEHSSLVALPIILVDPRRASASDGDLHTVPERVGQRGVVQVVEEHAQGRAGRRLWACRRRVARCGRRLAGQPARGWPARASAGASRWIFALISEAEGGLFHGVAGGSRAPPTRLRSARP